uniref:PIR Superfamily Protein n=1 Tax=Romanomermis culicivorax TaxID=13658 RepID=A0A915KM16_ROMCU
MHMASVFLMDELIYEDDDQIFKRAKRSNLYSEQRRRPRFEDWFPNNLHELDLNNINRHYECGEYSSLCRDYAGKDRCLKFDLDIINQLIPKTLNLKKIKFLKKILEKNKNENKMGKNVEICQFFNGRSYIKNED